MLNKIDVEEKNIVGKIILQVDKMSRLFFFKKDKYYSIVFPFLVKESYNGLQFYYINDIDVDSQFISNVISIIKSDSFMSQSSLDFADPIEDLEVNYDVNFWASLRELLLLEDGYVRYDKDLKSYNEAVLKKAVHKHPLSHYDICYTSNATFKIGLDEDLSHSEFVDLFNINTDCKYLKLPKKTKK
ncbi:MAG: hypothetical protein WBG43_02575 [Marinifilaceae bacterium]